MIDTLIVVVVLSLSGGPADKPADKPKDRAALIERLRGEFREAAQKADEATKEEQARILDLSDMRRIVEELEKNSVKRTEKKQ
jgi:hypothetical protein